MLMMQAIDNLILQFFMKMKKLLVELYKNYLQEVLKEKNYLLLLKHGYLKIKI